MTDTEDKMTEELSPISYIGLGKMMQCLGWDRPNYYPLMDKPIKSVTTGEDGEYLIFELMDGRFITYKAVGDCCSSSWIEHITVPNGIEGAVIDGYMEEDMGEFGAEYSDVTRVYQTSFRTPKGEIIVEYRNSSNGYYGGWLEGPLETWANDEIRDAYAAGSRTHSHPARGV